jgi:hypothetical protein
MNYLRCQVIDLETPEILKNLSRASRRLGELNGLCASLPDPQLLINTIVLRKVRITLLLKI